MPRGVLREPKAGPLNDCDHWELRHEAMLSAYAMETAAASIVSAVGREANDSFTGTTVYPAEIVASFWFDALRDRGAKLVKMTRKEG